MIANFVTPRSLLFVLVAASNLIAIMPIAAAPQRPVPTHGTALLTDLRAAVQQTLSRDANRASRCATQPQPQDCASGALSPFGAIDWISQTVVGDDLGDQSMFGISVAIDGNTALIGSNQKNPLGDPVGNGTVYVFTKSTAGWTQTQKLVSNDGVLGDEFGISVALKGDTAIIGAYRAGIGANAEQGAVYVFRPLAGAWTQTQKLSPADAPAGRMFGATISLDGDNALVSTPAGMMGDDPTTAPVYALHQTSGNWNIIQTLNADDYVPGGAFGMQTALSGTTALIGAPGSEISGTMAQGAAYVFNYVNDSWTQGQKLAASDGAEMSVFGWSVALDGTTALIGSPYATVGDNAMQGAAYVFNFEESNWVQTQKLTSIIGQEDERYGLVVALSNNTAVVVSAWTDVIEGVPSYGGAWLYTGTAEDGFMPQTTLLSPINGVSTFGYTAAFSGGTLLFGAPIDGSVNTGYAAFYTQDRIFANGFDN